MMLLREQSNTEGMDRGQFTYQSCRARENRRVVFGRVIPVFPTN